MHPRKKIEIVVEAVRAREVIELVERLGATGYTMLPVLAGKGHHGLRESGDLSGVNDTVMIIVIANEAVATAILDSSERILGDRTAIIYVSDVGVVRSEHF